MSERSPALADFLAQLPFELDAFQEAAIAALDAGRSVVVCAPTGSGKTLIGEYAIHRALTRQQRVFYTTPLKALSNQKWRDFQQQFGAEQVGLLTGDVSINRDAPILVMTTEFSAICSTVLPLVKWVPPLRGWKWWCSMNATT